MFSFHHYNKPGKKSLILVHILWLLKELKVLYGIKNSLIKSFTIKIAFLSTLSKVRKDAEVMSSCNSLFRRSAQDLKPDASDTEVWTALLHMFNDTTLFLH